MKDMNVRNLFIPRRREGHAGKRLLALPLALLAALPLSAQTVNLSVKKAPIEKVCKEIEKQTGFYFVYPKDMKEKDYSVSVDLRNEKVETAIAKVFEGSPFRYEVIDKVVSVNTTARPGGQRDAAPAEDTLHVKGGVYGNGTPLPGASIMTSKTKKMVLSDAKGMYKLEGVLVGEEIIVSFIGFEQKRIVVGTERNVGFFLKPAANNLDNVVVKAYGTTSKRFNTGNIVSVSGKEIENIPVMNPLAALEGRVPGLTITRFTADPSAPLKMEIRGRKNINPNIPSDPLVIIDHVPMSVLNLNTGSPMSYFRGANVSLGVDQSGVTLNGVSPFFGLSPRDIESIEVLKDADATAIYGSRGANGVILITTRKGKPGQTRVDVNLASGFNSVVKYPKMLKTKDYLQLRREAFALDGITPTATPGPGFAPDLMIWDSTKYTDWGRVLYGRKGMTNAGSVAVSGGSQYSTYRLGANYSKSRSIETTSGGASTAGMSVAVGMKTSDQRFRLDFTGNYNQGKNDASRMSGSIDLAPNAPDLFNGKGEVNFDGYAVVGNFPFNGLGSYQKSVSNNLTASLTSAYTIMNGLSLELVVGYNKSISESRFVRPASSQDNYTRKPTGSMAVGETMNTNLNVEPTLRYGAAIGQGKLDVVVGATYQANNTWALTNNGTEYTSDDLLGSISNAPKVTAMEYSGQYKYAGTYANIGYNWNGKYILSLNGNRDGSSRFGPGKQFGMFGSVGAAWILTEEPWVRNSLPKWIELLKLRGSYGTTGNDGAGDYLYLTQWSSKQSAGQQMVPYNDVLPFISQLHANDLYRWQSTLKSEVALETRLFDGKLALDLAVWRDRCNNQLVNFPTGLFTGFSSVYANSPANVQNQGWEATAFVQLLNRSKVRWSMSVMLYQTRNKLVSYPFFEKSPYYTSKQIGESLDVWYAFKYLGVDPKTGYPMYEDRNKDGEIGYNTDLAPWEGDRSLPLVTSPLLEGSINQSVTVGRFSMTALITFKKNYAYGINRGVLGQMKNVLQWEFDNRWTQPGDDALVVRPTTTILPVYAAHSMSDAQYSLTHTFRLQNVGIGYALPERWLKGMRIKHLAVRADANNLLLISDYKGADPDVYSYMPSYRTVNFGLNCSL